MRGPASPVPSRRYSVEARHEAVQVLTGFELFSLARSSPSRSLRSTRLGLGSQDLQLAQAMAFSQSHSALCLLLPPARLLALSNEPILTSELTTSPPHSAISPSLSSHEMAPGPTHRRTRRWTRRSWRRTRWIRRRWTRSVLFSSSLAFLPLARTFARVPRLGGREN